MERSVELRLHRIESIRKQPEVRRRLRGEKGLQHEEGWKDAYHGIERSKKTDVVEVHGCSASSRLAVRGHGQPVASLHSLPFIVVGHLVVGCRSSFGEALCSFLCLLQDLRWIGLVQPRRPVRRACQGWLLSGQLLGTYLLLRGFDRDLLPALLAEFTLDLPIDEFEIVENDGLHELEMSFAVWMPGSAHISLRKKRLSNRVDPRVRAITQTMVLGSLHRVTTVHPHSHGLLERSRLQYLVDSIVHAHTLGKCVLELGIETRHLDGSPTRSIPQEILRPTTELSVGAVRGIRVLGDQDI